MRVVVVVCCLLVLAGCSTVPVGDPESPPSGTATDTETVPSTTPTANGSFSVHVIHVGQGSSTLLVGPSGETMLIDTGDYSDEGEYVLSYLQRLGIERIDYLITTHADADHIGGHAAVIEYYETKANGIGAIYDPGIAAGTQTYEEYLDAVERYNLSLYETHAGDTIPFSKENLNVQVLGPPDPYLDDRDPNENSLALRITFGQTSFLFPGDVEHSGEQYLIDRYGKALDSTVLTVPHHGSNSSSSAAFLDTVSPSVASISSAYDSPYGHPHEGTLQRLAERSIPTYWTATHGTTVFVSNGETVTAKTQRAAPTDPTRLRDAPPIPPNSTAPVEPRRTFSSRTANLLPTANVSRCRGCVSVG